MLFLCESRFLARSYRIVTGKASFDDLPHKKNKTFVHVSLCHSIKAFAKKINRHFKKERNVMPSIPVEMFIHGLIGNELYTETLISHHEQLKRLLVSHGCTFVRQLTIDYNQIELTGGKIWDITAMQF